MPKISCIIPFGDMANGKAVGDRLRTLIFSLRTFYSRCSDMETVVVCQNTQLAFLDDMPLSNVRTIQVRYPIFNKSWLLNVGVKATAAPFVVLAEADMWAQTPMLPEAVKWLERGRLQWGFAWNRLFYTNHEDKELLLNTGVAPLERPKRIVKPTKGYSEGGFLVARRRFFEQIGACNEWLEELGGIDNEFVHRARWSTGTYRGFPQLVYHLWHDKVRQRRAPSRLKNVDILRYVQRKTLGCIRVLRAEPWGNPERPYCADRSFCQARMAMGV